jgi:diguanylate cyclase (GGDEF)-like protein
MANAGAGDGIAAVAALLHARLPRARRVAVYDGARRLVWQSGEHADFEVDERVAGLLPEALSAGAPPGVLALDSGRTALVLALPGGADAPAGLVVLTCAADAAAALADADALRSESGELLALLGSHVDLGRRLAEQTRRADETERELELVYRIDEKMHDTSRSHGRLAELVGQSGRFLGIAYSVLLIPGKRIRISATHSSWKSVNRKALDRYLIDKLFPRLEGQRAPVIFEMQAVPGSDDVADQGYQALVCPLLDRLGNLEGMLAQLGRIDGTPFRRPDSRFMSHIVRKVGYVIQQSFDPMTGLMNRAGFEAQLEESLTSFESEGDAHQVLYFDLDNLHLVNDTFGQEAGDEVIVRFAQIVEERLPKQAVATRLTGDDFAILLAHGTVDDALQLAAEIRHGTQRLRYLEGDKSLAISVSAGVAPLTAGGDVQEALTAARIACDSAKDHGRDRAEVYDEDDQSIVRRYDDMHLVAEIQRTLDGQGFELLAQPIVPLATRTRAGTRYEILLRMHDATGNQISSKAFFSAAERYQLMPQIDRWVVATVVRKLAPHVRQLAGSGTTFAINLSGQTLGDDGMLRFIEQELEQSGLAAGTLRFEVTESAAVSNRARAQALIDALRERGCCFALDDFGAGLSSFAYLKNFKVDTLKIDGSFIRDITSNRISESMVAAITQVAKVMQLETVAEYVESDPTRALVAKLGVDYAQGHGVGRPVPLDDVLGSLPAPVAQGGG